MPFHATHAPRDPHRLPHRLPHRRLPTLALPVLALALLAAALGTHPDAAPRQPSPTLNILEEARALEAQTRTHVSYAAFLSSLTTRLRIAGAASPQIRLDALDEADSLAQKAASYRNAAVAAQQGAHVVIEKSGQWPQAKLRELLDGAKEMLAGAESLRAQVGPGIIQRVLGEDLPEVLSEIASGRWSGFADDDAPAGPNDRPDSRDDRK